MATSFERIELELRESLASKSVLVVVMVANWQKDCKILIKELAASPQSISGVRFCQIDTDEDDEVVELLKVSTLPCVRVYFGGKMVASLIGSDATLANIQTTVDKIDRSEASTTTTATAMSSEEILALVSSSYAATATGAASCCKSVDSTLNGYSLEQLMVAGKGNLGLGCGNPLAFAALKPGDVVVDLGSGAGIDCFIAGQQVGPTGRVVGVDMTPEMVRQARKNAEENGYYHVSFRLGEIEYLPVADGEADVVISNCVINLSPNKQQVMNEMHRVLKPGGRVAIRFN